MTPLPPSSQGSMPSSRTPTIGGRVHRDVRLQAALALVIGIAVVAIPLFLWGRNKKKGGADSAASASASAAQVDDAGPPAVIFGDAGASLAVDAGGRVVTFGEPHYLKCQDPGPTKTAPEKCDHLGAIEDLVTKTIAERVAACLPNTAQSTALGIQVDVSFKRKKMRLKDQKDASSLPAAQRKKIIACFEKGLVMPNFDQIPHAHQRYLFSFLATFGASAGAAAQPATAPPPPPPIPAPITPQ